MSDHDLDIPVDLDELVRHQEGSIVSRVLGKTPGGTVTAFAFAAGEALSEHTAPFDALLHVFRGTARVTVGGTAHDVTAGRMIRLPAHVPHAVEAMEPFKMLLVMLRSPEARS